MHGLLMKNVLIQQYFIFSLVFHLWLPITVHSLEDQVLIVQGFYYYFIYGFQMSLKYQGHVVQVLAVQDYYPFC
jgi:hypothetical protein